MRTPNRFPYLTISEDLNNIDKEKIKELNKKDKENNYEEI